MRDAASQHAHQPGASVAQAERMAMDVRVGSALDLVAARARRSLDVLRLVRLPPTPTAGPPARSP